MVRKRGNSDGDVVGSRMVPASTKNSAAGVPGRTAVVVHGDERGINGSGFGDVKRRVRVVADGDDLVDRKGVAVKGVVDIGSDSGGGSTWEHVQDRAFETAVGAIFGHGIAGGR